MYDLIIQRNTAHIFEIIKIPDLKHPLRQIGRFCPYRRDHLLIMDQSRRYLPIRPQQSIHAKIRIIRFIPKITAVPPGPAAFGIRLLDSMIIPFPYESALKPLISPEQSLIFFEITGAVSHGMPVLAQNMRFPVAVIALSDTPHAIQSRIHGRIHIRDICLVITLIMDQSGIIKPADRFSGSVKILPH